MPIVRVELWPGRTTEQKAELAKALTDTLCRVAGVPAEATIVVFTDVPKENWAEGGRLASETHRK